LIVKKHRCFSQKVKDTYEKASEALQSFGVSLKSEATKKVSGARQNPADSQN